MIDANASCSNKVSDAMNGIFSFENLYRAYEQCTKGVKWKWSTQNYMVNACCRVARLRRKIIQGVYKSPPPRKFKVNERGKTREITALGFEDRIVNKCLCDNYLNPLLASKLVYDNGATIKGKGLSFTKNRVCCHLQRYFRKYGAEGYVLKMDIHHYFESIDHDVLISMIGKYVEDDCILRFIRQLVDTCNSGLGLGSQVSQISAVYYLNDVDHYLKENLHCEFYGRYMDDMYVISRSKEFLFSVLSVVRRLLADIGLELNDSKSRIYRLVDGFVFCKTRYVLTSTGKILRLLVSSSMKSMKRKIQKGIDVSNILPSFRSYVKQFTASKRLYEFEKKYVM